MKSLKKLFGLESIRPGIGDRVMHKNTRELGTVQGVATIHGSIKVHALTVLYDNKIVALQLPENEFIKVDPKTRHLLNPRRGL